MFGLDPTTVTAISAVLVALISGFYSWHVGRRKTSVDYAGVIQTGFASLIAELQLQHKADQNEIITCQSVVSDLSRKVSDLTNYIARLETFLRAHGLWDEAPKSGLVGIPSNGRHSPKGS